MQKLVGQLRENAFETPIRGKVDLLEKANYTYLPARVAELADARDSKSRGPFGPCGFDSRPWHQLYIAFFTFPLLMQSVQTVFLTFFPFSHTLTLCKFGFRFRLDLWLELLTSLPKLDPFPQISHLLAIIITFYFVCRN